MDRTHTARRVSTVRKVGWLTVASMLALALLAPAANAAPLDGAIWTSLADGATVNANLYDNKSDVYLNGGPQNCGNSNGLPDGDYYFQVTIPSGGALLSSDAIKFRQVQVVDGFIAGVSGSGNHAEGSNTDCASAVPVQLMPYDDTTNNGGEYSVDLAPIGEVSDCEGFDADSATFNFLDCNTSSKNDNFKVKVAATPPPTPTPTPEVTPTPTPEPTPTPTPVVTPEPTPTPTPFQSVLGETSTPTVTLPPTDALSAPAAPASDSWRLLLIAAATLLASVLVMTPARVTNRRRR